MEKCCGNCATWKQGHAPRGKECSILHYWGQCTYNPDALKMVIPSAYKPHNTHHKAGKDCPCFKEGA